MLERYRAISQTSIETIPVIQLRFWLNQHHQNVFDCIDHVWRVKSAGYALREESWKGSCYDPRCRAISEMPLCEAWELFDVVPSG